MTNQDVQNFINGLVDFIGMLFGAVKAALDVVPPVVLGFILVAAGILWLLRRARNG